MADTERPMIELDSDCPDAALALDDVLDAVWNWEVDCHGKHPDPTTGRAVFEAVTDLQATLALIDLKGHL